MNINDLNHLNTVTEEKVEGGNSLVAVDGSQTFISEYFSSFYSVYDEETIVNQQAVSSSSSSTAIGNASSSSFANNNASIGNYSYSYPFFF